MQKEKYLRIFTKLSKITLICAIIAVTLFLFWKNVKPQITKSTMSPIIAQDIKLIQSDVEAGNITEAEAQTRLINVLKQQKASNEKLNDGSVKSILKKMELNDPTAAKAFRQKIIEKHGEEGLKK